MNTRFDHVKVRFEHRLRGDVRFDTVEDLVSQLDQDCATARSLLS